MSEDIFEKEAEIKDAGSVYPTYSMENAKVEETEKEKKKRKKEKRPNPVFKFVRKTVAVVFLGTVLGGCAGGGFYLVTNYLGMDLFKPDESNQNIEVKLINLAFKSYQIYHWKLCIFFSHICHI